MANPDMGWFRKFLLLILPSLEKSMEINTDRAEVGCVQIYQYLIQKYKRKRRAKNSDGTVFLVVGVGLGTFLAGAG